MKLVRAQPRKRKSRSLKRAMRRRGEKPQLHDLILARRSPTSEPLTLVFWRHDARLAYETGDLEPLAKLFRSDLPLTPTVRAMLADVFESCKLVKGKGKLLGSAAQYALAARTVRRVMSGKLGAIGELSADEVRKLGLKMDDKLAPVQDAFAQRLSKLRDAKGRMSRKNAIGLIAPVYKLEIDKLTNWMDRKTGASRRHKVRPAHE